MGIRDTCISDEEAYIAKLKGQSIPVLIKKHHQKRVLLRSNGFVTVGGVVAAIPTAGVTLVSSGFAARQWDVIDQQRDLIGAELMRRGEEVPKDRLRDRVGGTMLGMVSLGTTLVLPGVVDGAVGAWAECAMGSVNTGDVLNMPVNSGNISNLVQGAVDGTKAAGLDQVASALGLDPNADVDHPIITDDPSSTASAAGQAIGVHALTAAEVMAFKAAEMAVLEKVVNAVNGMSTASDRKENKGSKLERDGVTVTVNDWMRAADHKIDKDTSLDKAAVSRRNAKAAYKREKGIVGTPSLLREERVDAPESSGSILMVVMLVLSACLGTWFVRRLMGE